MQRQFVIDSERAVSYKSCPEENMDALTLGATRARTLENAHAIERRVRVCWKTHVLKLAQYGYSLDRSSTHACALPHAVTAGASAVHDVLKVPEFNQHDIVLIYTSHPPSHVCRCKEW